MGDFLSRFECRAVEDYTLPGVLLEVGLCHVVVFLALNFSINQQIHQPFNLIPRDFDLLLDLSQPLLG